MALTLTSANLVRQNTYMFERNPGVFYELKALFLHLASNKGNPQLQFVAFDGSSMSSDGGAAQVVVANAACTLYAVYLKKLGTVNTWFKATDNATTCTTNGTQDLSFRLSNGNGNTNGYQQEEFFYTFPTGMQFVNGITIDENTTGTGATETLKANSANGFMIIGQ